MNRTSAELLVGVGAAGGSSAAGASLSSGLGAAPSLPTASECQELENKHVSIKDGFAMILQPAASRSFDLFFMQDPKSSCIYPHALNLLSWKFHENRPPHDFLLFHACFLDGKSLWEQPLLLILGVCLIFVAALYCVWQCLHAQGRVMGTAEKRDLKCFWILNDLFQADDARLCNCPVLPCVLPFTLPVCPCTGGRAPGATPAPAAQARDDVGMALPSSSSSSLWGSLLLSHYYVCFPILMQGKQCLACVSKGTHRCGSGYHCWKKISKV